MAIVKSAVLREVWEFHTRVRCCIFNLDICVLVYFFYVELGSRLGRTRL